MHFILASASLRRQELIQRLLSDVEVRPSDFDESTVPFDGDVPNYVKTLSVRKAQAVLQRTDHKSVALGSDTVVALDGRILGKPQDRAEAKEMLMALSGREHDVYSGIALVRGDGMLLDAKSVRTSVRFMNLSKEEIDTYLDTTEWGDKAGAYGIQGHAGMFVESIEGDYYNVMGLPLNTLYKLMKSHNLI